MKNDDNDPNIAAATERLQQALNALDRLEARWGPGVPCEDRTWFGGFLRAWFPNLYWGVYSFEWDARLRRNWLLSEIAEATRNLEDLKSRN